MRSRRWLVLNILRLYETLVVENGMCTLCMSLFENKDHVATLLNLVLSLSVSIAERNKETTN